MGDGFVFTNLSACENDFGHRGTLLILCLKDPKDFSPHSSDFLSKLPRVDSVSNSLVPVISRIEQVLAMKISYGRSGRSVSHYLRVVFQR